MSTTHSRDHEWSLDDVQVLHWPAQDALRRQLAAAELPRLLVLDRSSDAPEHWDCLEDWIRAPYSPVDFDARRAALAARAGRHQAS